MFSKIFSTLIVSFFILSCAEPKYTQMNTGGNDQNDSLQEAKANCQVRFQKSGLCLSWYWEKPPTFTEVGTLIFKTYRLNQFDQTPIEVDAQSNPVLFLWMPDMNHGSAPTQTEKLDTGTYRSSFVSIFMPGLWDLRFQIKSESDIIDEALVSVHY